MPNVQSYARRVGGITFGIVTAGSTLATATPLTAGTNVIGTVGAVTEGVSLPLVQEGDTVLVFNGTATACKVYPPTAAGKINGAAGGAAVTCAAGLNIAFVSLASDNSNATFPAGSFVTH
jgi:hypothetical protein